MYIYIRICSTVTLKLFTLIHYIFLYLFLSSKYFFLSTGKPNEFRKSFKIADNAYLFRWMTASSVMTYVIVFFINPLKVTY